MLWFNHPECFATEGGKQCWLSCQCRQFPDLCLSRSELCEVEKGINTHRLPLSLWAGSSSSLVLFLAKGVTIQAAPAQDKGFASRLLCPLQTYAGKLPLNLIQGCGLQYRKDKELFRVFHCVC